MHAPHAQVERALRHPDLRDLIAQIQNLDAGIRAETDGGAADLKLRAGTTISPEPVAADQGSIAHHIKPRVFTRRRVTHLTQGMTQVSHTPRRISISRACG